MQRAIAIDGICGFPTVTCTEWSGASNWWSQGSSVYRLTDSGSRGFEETAAVFSGSRHGLDADPKERGSLFIVFYARKGSGPRHHRSFAAFFTSGGLAVQHHIAPAGSMDRIRLDANMSDDGHRQEYIRVRGRRCVVQETSDPPTGVNGLTIWWTLTLPGDADNEIIVEVLADSTMYSQAELIDLIENFDGP